MADTLKITLVKSPIGAIPKHRATVEALGLTKLHKTVVMPNNAAVKGMVAQVVTSIGGWAFGDCSGLKQIELPSSVTYIDDSAFRGCSGLNSISVEEDNPIYDSREGCNAIIATESNELIVGCKNTKLPSSVTSIGEGELSMMPF